MTKTKIFVNSEADEVIFEEIELHLEKEISFEILIVCGIVSLLIFIANSSLIFLIIKQTSRTFLDYLMLLGFSDRVFLTNNILG